ncbi:MAG: iron-containing alcohol dehydrogenase [Nitrososphaerota archaeon]
MWENKISITNVFKLKYGGVNLYFGAGAINKIRDICAELRNKGISRLLIVTGKSSYKICGAWDHVKPALEEHEIEYALYDKVSANPTVDMVDEAVKAGREFKAQAVLGIGGGSPIDTAKAVAVLLKLEKTARELFKKREQPPTSLPIICINTTHGTGTEIDRYGVETIPETKYKIGMSLTYPEYSIDDPQLLVRLDSWQTIATAVDALNHVVESATNRNTTPFSIELAVEAARLIARYLPVATVTPENLVARYYLLYASMIAGIAIDHVGTHITHSLEHPLSAVKTEIPHGMGLGILLPAMVKTIYPAVPETLTEILKPIVPELSGRPGEAKVAASRIEEWLYSIGLRIKLSDYGFDESDIPDLVRLVKETPGLRNGLEAAPINVTEKDIERIYSESLHPLSSNR